MYSSVDLGDVHIPVCESEREQGRVKVKSESESDVHIPVSKISMYL